MTGVFSGGLAYEYSLEVNGFGMVKLNPNGSVIELEEFSLLAKAYHNSPDPEGDGGYKQQSSISQCPKSGKWWIPKNDSLPIIPGVAETYFQNGAGTAKGNTGIPKCSHWCGKNSTGLTGGQDGKSSPSKSAASSFGRIAWSSILNTAIAETILFAALS
jgi:hypothetical protein